MADAAEPYLSLIELTFKIFKEFFIISTLELIEVEPEKNPWWGQRNFTQKSIKLLGMNLSIQPLFYFK